MAAPGRGRCLGRLGLWVAVAAAAAAIGCRHEAPRRGRVHGTVTVDGAPLAKGQIRILAVTAGGIGTAGEVVAGAYNIPPDHGPTAGTYRVEIVSFRPTGRRVRDPDTNELVDELANVLPARYHAASTLQIQYDPGGDPTFNFELQTK
jgi:hypothetical protein